MTEGSDTAVAHGELPCEPSDENITTKPSILREDADKPLENLREETGNHEEAEASSRKRSRSDEDDKEEVSRKRPGLREGADKSEKDLVEVAEQDEVKVVPYQKGDETGGITEAAGDKGTEPTEDIGSGGQDKTADDLKGEGERKSSDNAEDTSEQKEEDKSSIFTFATSLMSTKEYVCPFNKLLEVKKNQQFFESPKAQTTGQTNMPNPFSEVDDNVNAIKKALEVNHNIKDDEVLLHENKSCTLAYYKEGDWNMPVPVVLQLLQKKTKESKRIVCYQVGTGRLQLNSFILPTMSIKKLKTRSIIFVGQLITDEATLAPHRVIFQDQAQRDAFVEHF